MRHLLKRFIPNVANDSSTLFVVDPYLDYRQRLTPALEQSIKRRRVDVDFARVCEGYARWWSAFEAYCDEPSVSLLAIFCLFNYFGRRFQQNRICAALQAALSTSFGCQIHSSTRRFALTPKTQPPAFRLFVRTKQTLHFFGFGSSIR